MTTVARVGLGMIGWFSLDVLPLPQPREHGECLLGFQFVAGFPGFGAVIAGDVDGVVGAADMLGA